MQTHMCKRRCGRGDSRLTPDPAVGSSSLADDTKRPRDSQQGPQASQHRGTAQARHSAAQHGPSAAQHRGTAQAQHGAAQHRPSTTLHSRDPQQTHSKAHSPAEDRGTAQAQHRTQQRPPAHRGPAHRSTPVWGVGGVKFHPGEISPARLHGCWCRKTPIAPLCDMRPLSGSQKAS